MPNPLNSKLIENYFALLGAHLVQMPEKAREEHLRELHQHLQALVAAHQESGASEDKAVSDALALMGDPAQIGSRLWNEWKLTTQRQFWKTVVQVGIAQIFVLSILDIVQNLWLYALIRHNPFYGLPTVSWNVISSLLFYAVPIIGGVLVGSRLPERAILAAFCVGFIGGLAQVPWSFYWIVQNHAWSLPGFGLSGYGILAAYIVSSLKRRDWTLQLQ